MYWFASQQQTSTSRHQNFCSKCPKFDLEKNELTLASKGARNWPEKYKKQTLLEKCK